MPTLRTTKEAAEFLTANGFPCRPGTLEVWRALARGPRYVKANRRVLYQEADLLAFAKARSQVVETTDSRHVSSVFA